MTKEQLLQRLTDIEWDDFEAKTAQNELPKNVWETVSTFANGSGGWVVLGVSQNGKKFEITGVSDGEKLEQDFNNVLRGREKFNVLIQSQNHKYEFDNKKVLAFFVPSSEQKPVYFNSLRNTFICTGSADRRATDSEINALLRDQLFGVMSARPVLRTTLDDLSRTTLFRYRNYMARMNPGLYYNSLSEDEFLLRLQIVDGDHLTYGGLLFMGKNPAINQTFPDFRVDLLEIPGRSYAEAATRYTFRLEEQENLWEYYFAIIERLKRYVNMPFRMNDMGFAFEDSPQFNAIREALVNLLMHSDYFSPMKPRVRIFSNRIEFENPGGFPRPVEELKQIDVSLPRNPVIAKLFRNVKLAENAGYGFDKMLQWEKSTHTKLLFRNEIDLSVVTFDIEKAEEKTKGKDELSGSQISEERDTKTTEKTTEKIIAMIRENPYVSYQELSVMLGITDDGVYWNIKKLKARGILERIGADKGGYWKVIENTVK
jgi:ATP-dependent DNA helicase RecG